MQWNSSSGSIFTFANNINTHRGSWRVCGLQPGATTTINAYDEKGLLKEKDPNLSGKDVREGLTAVISVEARRARAVRGPDEDQAGQPAGSRASSKETVNRKLGGFLEENPTDATRIVSKSVDAAGPATLPQGTRPHPAQVGGSRNSTLPGRPRRLLGSRTRATRGDLHRRGRHGRRLGQTGSRPARPQAVLAAPAARS